MQIDIWTDVVCPWCYIGKRRFEKALATFAHRDQVRVTHRSFQLDPHAPKGAANLQRDVLVKKYGMSPTQVDGMMQQVERTAAAEGLEYHLVGGKVGSTFDAHRLLHLAHAKGVQDAVLERLYRAHFTEQRSIFDTEALVQLAAEAGLSADAARAVLQSDRYADRVEADVAEAQELGARGVPFFVIDGKFGISGAQAPELFSQALARAWEDRAPAVVSSGEACVDDSCAVPAAQKR